MKSKVDQVVPDPKRGDPVTEEAIAIQQFLRSEFDTEIFAEKANPAFFTMPTAYITKRKSDVLIYHHQFGSHLMEHLWRKKLETKLVLRYHAVDPFVSFRGFDSQAALQNYAARRNLIMSGHLNQASSVIAETLPSARELENVGCENPVIMQPPIDLMADKKTSDKLSHPDAFNVFFAGRTTPAQMVEEVIKVWIHFIHAWQRPSELFLISQDSRCLMYQQWLQRTIAETHPESIQFLQSVAPHEMSNILTRSSVFLTMSEFEDFCVPIAYSMTNGIPVVANDCEGTRATLRKSGILVRRQDPETVAQILLMLAHDNQLTASIARAQTNSLSQSGTELAILRKCIDEII